MPDSIIIIWVGYISFDIGRGFELSVPWVLHKNLPVLPIHWKMTRNIIITIVTRKKSEFHVILFRWPTGFA